MRLAQFSAWKYIAELRWKGTGSAHFFDRRGAIADRLVPSRLPHWRMNQNTVELHTVDNDRRLFVSFQRGGMEWENPTNFKSFLDELRIWVDAFCAEVTIPDLTRIGFRTIYGAQVTEGSFEDVRVRVTDRSYNLGALLPKDSIVTDVGIVLDFKVGSNLGHMVLGPMVKQQFENYFQSKGVPSKLPELIVFVDVDIYQENPTLSAGKVGGLRVARFVEQAEEKARDLVGHLYGTLGV